MVDATRVPGERTAIQRIARLISQEHAVVVHYRPRYPRCAALAILCVAGVQPMMGKSQGVPELVRRNRLPKVESRRPIVEVDINLPVCRTRAVRWVTSARYAVKTVVEYCDSAIWKALVVDGKYGCHPRR